MEHLIILGLSGLLGAFIGSYLAGYLKKKGENLATHEDINKLVDQVRAVTSATKEIEARISDDVWDRQKRWELKRDVFFETTKRIAVVKDALQNLYAIHQTDKDSTTPDDPERHARRFKAGMDWIEATNRLDELVLLVDLVCGEEMKQAVGSIDLFSRKIGKEIRDGKPEVFMHSAKELAEKMNSVTALMRKEIKTVKST